MTESKEYRGDTSALSYKQKFDFDRFGNMYRKAANNNPTGQQNPLPYTPIEDADISKSTNRFTSGTTYDEAGNVINDAKFRSMTFAYDANGRMAKSEGLARGEALSVYDAAGMRVATKIGGIWEFVIYDVFGKLIAEYGSASDGPGGIQYVHQDWQGSVRTITNNAGFILSRTDHTAFGEKIASGVGLRTSQQGFGIDTPTKQGYALTEKDDATGMDHTWFRKNENQAGRWTSPDPYNGSASIGNPQSFNRYSYVQNQPTNFVDPSGLEMIPFTITVCSRWERREDRVCIELVIHWMDIGGEGGDVGVFGNGGGYTEPVKANAINPLCALFVVYMAAYIACLKLGGGPVRCNPLLTLALTYKSLCFGDDPPELPAPEPAKKENPRTKIANRSKTLSSIKTAKPRSSKKAKSKKSGLRGGIGIQRGPSVGTGISGSIGIQGGSGISGGGGDFGGGGSGGDWFN